MNALYKKYPYIVAWGWMLGSKSYFVDDECWRAEQDGAPTDAVYKSHSTGEWVRVGELQNAEARVRLEDRVAGRRTA